MFERLKKVSKDRQKEMKREIQKKKKREMKGEGEKDGREMKDYIRHYVISAVRPLVCDNNKQRHQPHLEK